jgi:uncharacterized protein YneF (UPF0154 family)
MTKYEVLNQLNKKELKPKAAYKLLFNEQKIQRAHQAGFVKLKIWIPENKGVSIFLGILFFLPIPLFIIRWVINRRINQEQISEQIPLTPKEIVQMISVRGAKLNVQTKDNVKISLKTI